MKPVRLRFLRNPATDEPHIYQHDVNEDEVEDVLRRPSDDFPGREGSRIALGQTRDGRYLQVVYVPDPGRPSAFVITAYELRGKPLAAFKRRQRKKPQR
jgi:hypothetical protein